MKSLIRYNIKEKFIIKSYPIYEDEIIVQIDNAIYVITQKEFEKYINGEIEVFEFNEPSFELEENEMFIFR